MAANARVLPSEKTIYGPFVLYDGSIIIEWLKADESRDATVMMKSTYKQGHSLCKKGKGHPQAPPFHVHFLQSETFQILAGTVGTTTSPNANTPIQETSYLVDTIWTPESTKRPIEITPWTIHSFWPDPDATEDGIMVVWAHPTVKLGKQMDNTAVLYPPNMDDLFFMSLVRGRSDAYEGKGEDDILQLMLMQHESSSTLVLFPTAWWLGPLRWWIPLQIQAAFASLARWQGKLALTEKYCPPAQWKAYIEAQKKGGKAS